MKTKIIRVVLLLLIFATQASTIFTAALEEYKNASVTAINWDENNTPFVLLGKEERKDSGGRAVWCDFFGRKDKKDGDDPLVTAKREALEESADQLDLVGDPLYRYRGKKNRSTVHFFWRAKYVAPRDINKCANGLRAAGKGHDIEKTAWHWAKLQDLLDGKSGLELHKHLASKLEHPNMGQVLKLYLAGIPETEEEDGDDDGQREYEQSE